MHMHEMGHIIVADFVKMNVFVFICNDSEQSGMMNTNNIGKVAISLADIRGRFENCGDSIVKRVRFK